MTSVDPITAELIRNGLQSVVDEMALTLVRTAYSANLKSAMDLSSAICDRFGRLIAQGRDLTAPFPPPASFIVAPSKEGICGSRHRWFGMRTTRIGERALSILQW